MSINKSFVSQSELTKDQTYSSKLFGSDQCSINQSGELLFTGVFLSFLFTILTS